MTGREQKSNPFNFSALLKERRARAGVTEDIVQPRTELDLKPIIDITININRYHGEGKDERRKIRAELTNAKLWGDQFAYSAYVPTKDIKQQVVDTGTVSDHRDHLVCCTLREDPHNKGELFPLDTQMASLIIHAKRFDTRSNQGAFAVYNLSELNLTNVINSQYTFKNPEKKRDALVGVIWLLF